MQKRISTFIGFVGHFFRYLMYIRDVLIGLVSLLLIGGVAISYVEDIPFGQAIYFAFITGMSIGYGDITPKTGLGCIVSVGIGLVGMIFTGMNIAVATRALADSIKEQTGGKQ